MKAFLDRIDTASIIAITLVAALVVLTFVLVFHNIPEGVSDVFKLLVGSLLTLAGTIVTFYFGSSSGSKDKDKVRDDTLKSAVEGLSNNNAGAPPSGNLLPNAHPIIAFFAVMILSLAFTLPALAQDRKLKLPIDPLHLNSQPSSGGANAASSNNPAVACDFR